MILIRRIAISILTFLSYTIYSQDLLDSIPFRVDSNLVSLRVDKLNNTWFIYSNSIIRQSENKSYIDTLSIPNFEGRLTIDLKFPLKNLFYDRFKNTIEVFNSRWGSLTNFCLDNLNIYEPSVVRFASDKTIWVLDKSNNKLHKVSETGVKTYERGNPFHIQNEFYFPTEFIDLKNIVIALDTNYGLFLIDDYGNLMQDIPIDSARNIYRFDEYVVLSKENCLKRYDYNSNTKLLENKTNSLTINEDIISLEQLKGAALIFNKSKRIYKLKDFSNLFSKKTFE